MDCVIETCGKEKLAELIGLRLEFVEEFHPEMDESSKARLYAITEAYFSNLIAENRYLGFILRIGGLAAGTAGLLFYELPPLEPDAPPRCTGHVLNFHIKPPFRRQGYGRSLMETVKAQACSRGIARLVLNSSAMGESLYRSCGFHEPDGTALVLDL